MILLCKHAHGQSNPTLCRLRTQITSGLCHPGEFRVEGRHDPSLESQVCFDLATYLQLAADLHARNITASFCERHQHSIITGIVMQKSLSDPFVFRNGTMSGFLRVLHIYFTHVDVETYTMGMTPSLRIPCTATIPSRYFPTSSYPCIDYYAHASLLVCNCPCHIMHNISG